MCSSLKIAIDGYSSCGKSTLARDLANKLNYIFIDSGAMYRAVTLFAIQRGMINTDKTIDRVSLTECLDQINIDLKNIEGKLTTYLNGTNVESLIREKNVTENVSLIAAIPEVRTKLVQEQRLIGENGGIVMDGRDIGTVVFPDADLKLFVTASIEIRTQRRFKELQGKGIEMTKEEVEKNLLERDYIDSTREIAPLRKAEDALEIDNSLLTREDQLNKALELVAEVRKKLESCE